MQDLGDGGSSVGPRGVGLAGVRSGGLEDVGPNG